MKTYAILGAVALLGVATPLAGQWNASRADSHAPIGVMGDHPHEAGEVMLSYRYMTMSMEGSRIGSDPVADADIVSPAGGFMITPTRMPMTMQMFGAMFAPSDRITLMAMVPLVSSTMDHITRHGGSFTTESSGLGDIRVGALVGLAEWGNQSLLLNAIAGVPTGSIEQTGVLPISEGREVQLPYPMQLGSGTFDLHPGLTWLGQAGDWSWGAQTNATIRMGRNSRDWALGNKLEGTAWWARGLGRHLSAGLRLVATRTGDIDGMDAAPSVNPAMVPTARTDLRAGTVVEGGLSVNVYIPQASAFRIAAEVLMPLVRNLDGPQLERDLTFVLGLQVVPIRH